MKQAELFSEPETISASVAARMKQQAVVIQNGTWTVQNQKTGQHRTFRIRTQHAKARFAPGQRIVSVMSGTDNEHHYTGFGFIINDDITVWNSKRGDGKPSMFEWYADMIRVLSGKIPSQHGRKYSEYTIEGSGQCYICNKKLTNPLSLETGIGPVCAGRD